MGAGGPAEARAAGQAAPRVDVGAAPDAPAGQGEQTARLYALLHAGNQGDLAFYRDVCRGAATALELGCGAGRILAPLAADGVEVTGLDNDPARLAFARRALQGPRGGAGATLVVGDMRDFALGRRFDRVLIPFNGLFALGSVEAMGACLRAARRHLAGDGILAFDVYRVDEQDYLDEEPWESDFEPVTTLMWRGQAVSVDERNAGDGTPGHVHVSYRVNLPEGPVVQHVVHRFAPWSVIEDLVRAAGFGGVEARGGFDGAPLDETSSQVVVLATVEDPDGDRARRAAGRLAAGAACQPARGLGVRRRLLGDAAEGASDGGLVAAKAGAARAG
ncbi:MAG: hypothetical protein CSA66_02220 [Proteobacteria bacterium]|nr:MAG: hypothetical protein CSA66_02220 [Pseudomonadota bacterium]